MAFRIGKIRISAVHIIWAVIINTLFMGILTDGLGVPSAIRYINDLFILFLLFMLMNERNFWDKLRRYHANGVMAAIWIYSFVNVSSLMINGGSFPLILWAVRNTYRFFIFYIACVFYLRKKDIETFFSFLCRIQWLNLVIVLYQFFVLGLKQDVIGGIFGHGANAAMLIYSLILVAYAMTMYIHKEYPFKKLLPVLVTTSLCCVLAEIRVYFFLVLVILALNLLTQGGWGRKIGILIIGFILGVIALDIYAVLFPYVSFSLKDLIREGTSQGGGYNISRLNAFREINKIFFHGDWILNLFGYGFGNCEYSNFSMFTSDFYRAYGEYHYRWFAHQWIFLETGYLGVITYLGIIFSIIISGWRHRKILSGSSSLFNIVSVAVSLICVAMFFYNSLLKGDFAYLGFFGMAISGVVIKNMNY